MMDDNWELAYFSTLARNGSGDFDIDGMTDLNEYLAGTNPTNAASKLSFTQETHAPTSMLLRFTAVAGKTCRLHDAGTFGV